MQRSHLHPFQIDGLGSWITYQVGYSNSNGGFAIIPFLVGVVVAVVLIAIYLAITGRRDQVHR